MVLASVIFRRLAYHKQYACINNNKRRFDLTTNFADGIVVFFNDRTRLQLIVSSHISPRYVISFFSHFPRETWRYSVAETCRDDAFSRLENSSKRFT